MLRHVAAVKALAKPTQATKQQQLALHLLLRKIPDI
jgi:hypothetical protein